ncbi:MKI67 FHA domain-interacting nucleolar phosphoprotein [Lucilia sericata]|uniref:MKI67 FHA domain-interacting nucleolar phosphoprotein n=1 Tax=Lucilia sericata TaxID=13632 RepID=UPI0018A82374|nr:MKI67 FHA domain-interacting nucleolar phosphoprotein [Lucilia sericata]
MPPVKKQKPNKSPKTSGKDKKQAKNAGESVVSGQLQKKINKIQPKKDPKGVVFIKHLPHGFFEEQLKKYFEQFGNVTRVRLARSRRTGNSKGYAFVEFEYPEVAEVAAETMDNYLMFKKIVKATYIPPEKQQFNYFRTSLKKIKNKSGKYVWVSSKTAAIQQKMKNHNDWSEENYQKRTQKQLAKLKKIGKKYAHLGIDINEIIAKPKILTDGEKKAKGKAAKEEEKTASSSKATKRKTTSDDASSNKQQKPKKKVALEDLLGNTIQEDSDDEDYIAMAEDSEAEDAEVDEDSSDEETYGFTKGSDNEEDEDSENESAEEEPVPSIAKKSKKNFGKSLKSSNVERFDQMLKRKPHTGGISKFNKKSLKQPSGVSKNKTALQMSAAKEVAKPLSKVKGGKLAKPLKSNKNLKKVK